MWSLIVLLVPFAVSMTASPRPNNMIAMVSATNFGFRRTVPVITGFVGGLASMILAAGLGLGQVFVAWPEIHQLLKYVAIAYLLYLAWKIARSGSAGKAEQPTNPMSLMQGALFQWINPKAWIVSISAITTFTAPQGDEVLQTLVITTVIFLVAFASVSTWALFRTAIARILCSSRALKIFNLSMAALLVVSLYPLVMAGY
ncbi:MAG: LysE family translocator [Amphritea sp.]